MIKPKLHNFENSILNNLLDKDYINHNETIIIAVSGGKDSMALLYAMTRINPLLKIKIVAAHINHHLRENSSEDELFIRTFCKEQNIELIIDHLNPSQKLKSMSKEEWARDFRYKSLYRISSDYGSCNIMTAHHGNDQIETILFHLSQGAGLAGLRGIHTQRDRVIRPLLSLSRKEINVYLEEMDIPWVQDKTNNDTTIPRNFLRHKIIKSWEKENSGLVSSFNQISQNIKDAYESLIFSAKILSFSVRNNDKRLEVADIFIAFGKDINRSTTCILLDVGNSTDLYNLSLILLLPCLKAIVLLDTLNAYKTKLSS